MKIVTALNDGPDFNWRHVKALYAQCQEFSNGVDFVCITNQKIGGIECVKPNHNWPGWWIKQEIYDPRFVGDLLWMDLDTVIVGPISDLLKTCRLTMLRDFYRDGKRLKEGLQASLMMLPTFSRALIWNDWISNPANHMAQWTFKGDQPMLEKHFLNTADRWQDVLPGQCVSWKVNCDGGNAFRKPSIPPDARVIVFHGKPRPFDVPQFQHLYE